MLSDMFLGVVRAIYGCRACCLWLGIYVVAVVVACIPDVIFQQGQRVTGGRRRRPSMSTRVTRFAIKAAATKAISTTFDNKELLVMVLEKAGLKTVYVAACVSKAFLAASMAVADQWNVLMPLDVLYTFQQAVTRSMCALPGGDIVIGDTFNHRVQIHSMTEVRCPGLVPCSLLRTCHFAPLTPVFGSKSATSAWHVHR